MMTRDENGVTTLYNVLVTHFNIIVIYEVTADLKAELAQTLLSHTAQSEQLDGGADHFALRPQKRGGLLGTGTGRGGRGGTADTARKRPERPWTVARTMEVLRRCPLAIAQRLVHCAVAVSTAVLGQSHKDNVRCTAVEEQLEAKEVQLSQPSSTSLLIISFGLT